MKLVQKRNTNGLIYMPKLTPDQVRQIRADYLYGSRTCNLRTLAEHYGVCINTIHSVVLNKTWKCDEYAKRLVDHPIQEKRRFDAVLECQQKAQTMHADFLAAKDDAKAMKAFFKAYSG